MLILGSSSPRRKEILSYFSLPFQQRSPDFDEDAIPFCGSPEDFVRSLSAGKAASLAKLEPEAMILTADTIVYREGKIYGKPTSEEDAFHRLKELVGNWHTVYTGITLQSGSQVFHQEEATQVLFNSLTDEQIRHYISIINWRDKAGGYAIQMAGGLIVQRIEGCYYNVMGLPINSVAAVLMKMGINLWNYL